MTSEKTLRALARTTAFRITSENMADASALVARSLANANGDGGDNLLRNATIGASQFAEMIGTSRDSLRQSRAMLLRLSARIAAHNQIWQPAPRLEHAVLTLPDRRLRVVESSFPGR